MHRALRNSAALAAVVLALSCAGCSFTSSCNRAEDTVVITTGKVYGNTYISAPNDSMHRGPFAHFPPARTLEFVHGLPYWPPDIAIWLAFQEEGTLAPSAGNSSLLLRPTTAEDDKMIRIKNDTCSEFWVWVVASVPVLPAPEGDAGVSASDPTAAAGANGTE